MSWLRLLLSPAGPGPRSGAEHDAPSRLLDIKLEHTETAIECAFSFGWQAQNWRFGLAEHSARVALLSRWIAEEVGVPEDDIVLLEHAAQLHELGMIAVPHSLICTPRPLTAAELARVRSQALIGGEIVRSAYDALKGDLIECQYSDYVEICRRFPDDDVAADLAGILRVADVFDTLLHPRPYQKTLPPDRWQEVLGTGIGSRFHPEATTVLLRLAGAPEA